MGGVEGFEYECRAEDVAVSCDEGDGPVRFHLSSEVGHFSVALDVLRRALDEAEAHLLSDREAWKSLDWNEPA